MPERFDVAIVGGGVVGSAIARQLSRYRLKVVVLERASDVARGTSGKNSGVAHTGINVPTGFLKAKLNVAGARVFGDLCRELDVPYKMCGKLVVALKPEETPDLEALLERGNANGVPQLEIVDEAAIRRMEPNINGYAALHAPTAAIVCPYTLTIALAESAAENGVEFWLESPVTAIDGDAGDFQLTTPRGVVRAGLIVNSAGLYSDKVAAMAGVERYKVYPCRGEYVILDKSVGGLITRMVYPVPPKGGAGLGVHITPTVDGNILLGPSAVYVGDPDDVATTLELRRQLVQEASEFLSGFSPRDVITAYSGMRPKLTPEAEGGFGDFVIEEAPERKGMMHLVGIESPGLTAAPAIADVVAEWVGTYLTIEDDPGFDTHPLSIPRFRDLPREKQVELIERDSDFGHIVCRCELVTKAEVLGAMHNALGAVALNSIKYRSRSMMGRCRGGFCGPRIVDLLIENGHTPESLNLNGDGSWLFTGMSTEERAEAVAAPGEAGRN